ncbi:MAG: hypothetical protein ACREFP_04055 [Acetobacteraceae bacterium]
MLRALGARYRERLIWWGQAPGDITLMLTEQPDLRTWTLLAVHDGEACMVDAGGTERAWGS